MSKKLLLTATITLLVLAFGIKHVTEMNPKSQFISNDIAKDGLFKIADEDMKLTINASKNIREHNPSDAALADIIINEQSKNELESDQLNTYTSNQAKIILGSIIDDAGLINSNSVSSILIADDFNLFINEMRENASIEESEIEMNLETILVQSEELNSSTYKVSCGNKVCALNLENIQPEYLDQISENVIYKLPLGSIFKKTLKDEYGNLTVRVIYQMEESSSFSTRLN